MKNILILLIIILRLDLATTQITFAPVGAVWTYKEEGMLVIGNFKFESLKDTSFNNINFRKISEFHQYKNNFQPTVTTTRMRYFTQSNDTIFEWKNNKLNYSFHYNLKENDTLRFPLNWQVIEPTILITSVKDTSINGKKFTHYNFYPIKCSNSRILIINGQHGFYKPMGPFWAFLPFSGDCQGNYDGPYYRLCSYKDDITEFGTPCEVTSMSEITPKITLKLYPNPSFDFLNIETKNNFKNFQIFDLNGKIIENGSYTEGHRIDISKLEKGFYFLQLIDNQGNYNYGKFLKLN